MPGIGLVFAVANGPGPQLPNQSQNSFAKFSLRSQTGTMTKPELPSPPPELPGGWPEWFDPTQDLMLTPKRLGGLLHPIRAKLLNLLESDGPATASQLGRRIGESSGVTSYHLRILAEHGFIEDDEERSNGRDRVWRAGYRGSAFTFRSPDDPPTRESVELGAQYIRLLVDDYYRRMVTFLNSLSSRVEELEDLPWTFADIKIEVTTEEGRQLSAEIQNLVERYRRPIGEHEVKEGSERGVFMFQVLPDEVP
jgi:DNA-binding transcriptional ArsR family regulator